MHIYFCPGILRQENELLLLRSGTQKTKYTDIDTKMAAGIEKNNDRAKPQPLRENVAGRL